MSAQPPPEKYLTSHEDDEGEEYFASNWGTEFDAVEPHRLPLPWTFGDVWEETTSGAPYADATLNNVPINPGKLWPPAFMVRLPGYSTIWFRWSPRPAPKKDRKGR